MLENIDIKNTSDAQLVMLSLENNNHFASIVDRYEQKLMRYIQRMSSLSQQDYEDLLQNIFLKVFLNLRAYNKKLSFNAWIYRIAHNEVIDLVRKSNTKKKYGGYDHDDHDDHLFESLTESGDIVSEAIRGEDKKRFYQALADIDIKYKEVLVLYYLESYSYRDIGDMLKKPSGTIATLISRAKKKLKKSYENIT